MTFIAGPYDVTYSPGNDNSFASIGQTEEDGVDVEYYLEGENVTGHYYGKSVQDLIYQGGQCFINLVLIEYNLSAAGLIWPFHSTIGRMGEIGRTFKSDAEEKLYGSLKLTRKYSQSTATIATRTFGSVCLPPNYPIHTLFAAGLRRLPLRLIALPYDVGSGNIGWFVDT